MTPPADPTRAALEFYAQEINYEPMPLHVGFGEAPVEADRGTRARAALAALGARGEAEKPKCGELDLSGEIACHRAAGHTGFHEGKPPVVTFGVNMTLRGGA